jgi:hypothetical protein
MAHFLGCRAERISNNIGGFMKTGLTKKQKVTEFYFNERDDLAEIYTHNTDLKSACWLMPVPTQNCVS